MIGNDLGVGQAKLLAASPMVTPLERRRELVLEVQLWLTLWELDRGAFARARLQRALAGLARARR